jgi:hypothetical protein
MAEEIPVPLRAPDRLRAFFEQLFPGGDVRGILFYYCSSFLSFLALFVISVSVSLLSISCCPPAFSDTTWHESNHRPPALLNQSSIDIIITSLITLQVLHVGFTLDITELRKACGARRLVCNKLESAIAVWKGSGVRPCTTIYPWQSPDGSPYSQPDCPVPLRSETALRCIPVQTLDSIDYLAWQLTKANESVVGLQRKVYVFCSMFYVLPSFFSCL